MRPNILLLADPGGLSASLVEILLSNLCEVIVASDQKNDWEKVLLHLNKNSRLTIIDNELLDESVDYNYVICISLTKEASTKRLSKEKKRITKAITISTKRQISTYIVLPYQQYTKTEAGIDSFAVDMFSNYKEHIGLLYTGDLVGPRIFLSSFNPLCKMIKETLSDKNILIPENPKHFYPIDPTSVARHIAKTIFSFGGTGRKMAIIGKETTPRSFANKIKSVELVTIGSKYQSSPPAVPKRIRTKQIEINSRKILKETFAWYKKNKIPGSIRRTKGLTEPKVRAREKEPKVDVISRKVEKTKIFAAFLFIAILPYVFLIFSYLLLLLSTSYFSKGELSKAKATLSFSKYPRTIALSGSTYFSMIPGVGKVYLPGKESTEVIDKLSQTLTTGVEGVEKTKELVFSVLSDKQYNLSKYQEDLAISLDTIYRELSFIESEFHGSNVLTKSLSNNLLGNMTFKEARAGVLLAKRFVQQLDLVLGDTSSKKYLVLLQDSTELRPTGGFIDSILTVEFKDGHIFSINHHDVSSLDAQLKGGVVPPKGIASYLNEKNWFLRDSNWDPDFPTSAVRAEWFIDKEIGESFDGVFAVNYDPAKIDKENGIEDTVNNLIEKVPASSEKELFDFAKKLSEQLQTKNIQLFFHEKGIQDIVSELMWDGSVYQPTCQNNCYTDYLGIVEANVGINKANRYLKRKAHLKVVLESGFLKKSLVLEIENMTPVTAGFPDRYKSYVRLLVPQDSEFNEIGLQSAFDVNYVEPDIEEIHGRKEAGVLIDIPAGESLKIIFKWESLVNIDFGRQGEYGLVWRKQAGTGDDPMVIDVSFPNSLKPTFDKPFILTREAVYNYNTNLARDFASRIFW